MGNTIASIRIQISYWVVDTTAFKKIFFLQSLGQTLEHGWKSSKILNLKIGFKEVSSLSPVFSSQTFWDSKQVSVVYVNANRWIKRVPTHGQLYRVNIDGKQMERKLRCKMSTLVFFSANMSLLIGQIHVHLTNTYVKKNV